jgi:predicted nucleic acid-binding protein
MTSSGPSRQRLALDTSAYAHLRTGHDDTLTLVAAAESVFVPAVVLGELEAGFELGRRAKENRIALGEFLSEPFVRVVPVTHEVARRYGALLADLRRRGTPVPTHAIWVAASALEAAAPLLTFDRDFERMERLETILLSR